MPPKRSENLVCKICGYDRGVQKCHIIPMRMLKLNFMGEDGRFMTQKDGGNILYLCPNCHWCFDHFLLKSVEFEKVKDKVLKVLEIYMKLVNIPLRDGVAYKDGISIGDDEFISKCVKWMRKMSLSLGDHIAQKKEPI